MSKIKKSKKKLTPEEQKRYEEYMEDLKEFNSGKFSDSMRGLRIVKLGAL